MRSCETATFRDCHGCIFKGEFGCRVWECNYIPVGEAVAILRDCREDWQAKRRDKDERS